MQNMNQKLNIPEEGKKTSQYKEIVDRKMYEENFEKVKKNEVRFFAFLNKEFNILNKKSVKCCSICYSNPSVI